jgi:hypothetical protein
VRRPPFQPLPQAVIAEARRLFERRTSREDIARRLGISVSTIDRHAAAGNWTPVDSAQRGKPARRVARPAATGGEKARRRTKSASRPRPRKARAPAGLAQEKAAPAPPAAQRLAGLRARLVAAAERQVAEIERRIGAASRDATERERDARAFAIIVRTLKDLASLDEPAAAGADASNLDEDEAIERAADDYRAQLARMLDAMPEAGSEPAAHPGGHAGAAGESDDGELDVSRAG